LKVDGVTLSQGLDICEIRVSQGDVRRLGDFLAEVRHSISQDLDESAAWRKKQLAGRIKVRKIINRKLG
jgi:hypothetical protein